MPAEATAASRRSWLSHRTEEYFTTPDKLDENHHCVRGTQEGDVVILNGRGSLATGGFHAREFILRHTLSYWVSISFMLGSLMFMVGAVADLLNVGAKAHRAFVTVEYIAGASAYFVGCYAGFLAVINLARKDKPPPGKEFHSFRFWAVMRTRRAWWAQLSYTIGGIWFGAGTLCTSASPRNAANFVYTAGSVHFITGAALEVWTNDGFAHFRPRKLAFWISWSDLIGSCFFFAGSLAGFWKNEFLVDVCFFAGCWFFLGSSLGGLWMWKLEQCECAHRFLDLRSISRVVLATMRAEKTRKTPRSPMNPVAFCWTHGSLPRTRPSICNSHNHRWQHISSGY